MTTAPGRSVIRCAVVATSMALVAGCGSSGGVRAASDSAVVVSWVAAAAPGVYARTDARYSRAARDYVYIGPVAARTAAAREYFLWVGVGTTLDRGFLAPADEPPETITLLIDGEPIDLEVFAWTELTGAGSMTRPYDPPVRPLTALGARVTRDLITRINTAAPSVLSLTGPGGESRQFFAWGPMPSWSGLFGDDLAR